MHTSLHYRMGGYGGLGILPVVPIVIGVSALVSKLIANSGCGPTCIRSSEFANQAGDLMGQNMNAYVALPAPRPKSTQIVALQNFDSLWAQLVNLCTNDPTLMGTTAGRNCIQDRQAGACKWRAAPGGWVQSAGGGWTYKPWGPAGSGSGCWNYFVGMRDPIANDPAVFDDTQPAPVPVLPPVGVPAPVPLPGLGPVPSAGVPATALPGIAAPGVGLLMALVAGGLLLYKVMS